MTRWTVLATFSLLLPACGTALYDHTIAVSPARGDLRVGVFDHQGGTSREWAHESLGDATAARPYTATLSTTAAVSIGSVKDARPVTVALAVPEITDAGYFLLTVERPVEREQLTARFCRYGEYFPAVDSPSVPVLATATAEDGDWDVLLILDADRLAGAIAGAVAPASEP